MGKKKNKKKKYIIIAIIIIVIIAGYMWMNKMGEEALDSYAKSAIIEEVAKKDAIEVKITENGVIEPNKKYEIFAPMGGTVTYQYKKEGESVSKDGNLFKIGGYNIKSPVAGKVITTNVEEDDYVQTTSSTGSLQPVAIVADMSKLKFDLAIDELDINKINVGMEVEVTADAVEGKVFKGVVSKINAEGKSTNGVTTYNVTVEIADYGELKIGMNVDATILVEKKENVIIIPIEAINKTGNETYVYVRDENSVATQEKMLVAPKNMSEVKGYRKQNVTVGISNKDFIEITEGLNEEEKVYYISNSKSLTEYMLEQSSGSGVYVNGEEI